MKRNLFPILYVLGVTLSCVADLPDPNGWWKLDEGSGSTAADSSGNGYHGTIYGTPEWGTDFLFENVLNFNGSSNQVKVPGYLGVSGGQSRTVCAWIKTTQLSGGIVNYGSAGTGTRWLFILDGNGKLQLGISGGNITSKQIVADGQWHHVAAVLEAPAEGPTLVQHLRLYIDGRPAAGTYTNPDTEINTVPEYPVRIGVVEGPAGALNSYFDGQIHDVRMYNTVLSDGEIYQIFREQAEPMGIGTPEHPYKIGEPNQLIVIGSDPDLENSCFILINDIVFDPENNPEHIFTKSVIPVFGGIFDGQNHAIHNLRIELSEPYNQVGFFGYSGGSDVIIKNLHLKNIFIYDHLINNHQYPSTYYNCMGGLIGKNGHVYDNPSQTPPPPIPGATVINCSVSGSITGYSEVGGLVGFHVGSAILQCRSDCSVYGTYCVGGICGYKHFGSIKNSFSTGVVSGDPSIYHRDSRFLGGLCGDNSYGSISHCYATASIFGESYLGGLCGDNYYGTISECYATGSVSGDFYDGGLCGNNNSSISSCYFLNTAGPDNGYGEPLTDSQMTQQDSFVYWDFVDEGSDGPNNIWRMCFDGIAYPKLSWEYGQNGDFTCPDGVGIEDLETLASHWLTADSQPDFNYACDGSGDGFVGQEDMAVLSSNWLEELWEVPLVSISPRTVVFTADEAGNDPNWQEVIVQNAGIGTLEWALESEEPMPGWLSIDPVSGSLKRGEGQSLILSVDISGLAAGDYAYTFNVADPNAANSPQTVTINLHIRGLVAYWALDEEGGTTAADSSGNGHHGTLVKFDDPNSSWVSGKAGNCLTFDGINDNVKIITYKGIEGRSSRTVCAWIKTSQLNGGILNYGSNGTGTRWIFFVNENGNLQLGVNGGNIISTQIIADGQWHHAAAVLEAPAEGPTLVQHLRLYIDGQPAAGAYTNPDTEINTVLEFPVRIGVIQGPIASTFESYFGGLIDEVWLYDVALSAEQIALLAAE